MADDLQVLRDLAISIGGELRHCHAGSVERTGCTRYAAGEVVKLAAALGVEHTTGETSIGHCEARFRVDDEIMILCWWGSPL